MPVGKTRRSTRSALWLAGVRHARAGRISSMPCVGEETNPLGCPLFNFRAADKSIARSRPRRLGADRPHASAA